jgi:hypothetical protein
MEHACTTESLGIGVFGAVAIGSMSSEIPRDIRHRLLVPKLYANARSESVVIENYADNYTVVFVQSLLNNKRIEFNSNLSL